MCVCTHAHVCLHIRVNTHTYVCKHTFIYQFLFLSVYSQNHKLKPIIPVLIQYRLHICNSLPNRNMTPVILKAFTYLIHVK